jgi:hypothetical protein
MKLYCGIDLHSNNSVVSVINELAGIIYEKRLPNDLATIRNALQPHSVIVYVTELDRLPEIHKVRSEFFTKPYPASTLVQVVGLVHSDLLFEMSAVAVIPRHRFRRPA